MNQLDLMKELIDEDMVVIKELFDEEIKPLIKQRAVMERKIGIKAINELYALEKQV